MKVGEAIAKRRSTRAFLPTKVERKRLVGLLDKARRAPSGGNLQPWQVWVVDGAKRDDLVAKVKVAFAKNPGGEGSEYNIYPPGIAKKYAARRSASGRKLYQALGIGREDRSQKLAQLGKNFEFFGAPAGMFFAIDRSMDSCQWADIGMFMQNLMLLATADGLATCPQESWAIWPKLVGSFLSIPSHMMLFCGMAIGYADSSHRVNQIVTERAEVGEFCTFA